MHFSDFQKKMIILISEGKVVNTAGFLLEICRDKSSNDVEFKVYSELIETYMIKGQSTDCRPYILLPYTNNEVLGMFFEFYSLLDTLSSVHLIVKHKGIHHRTLDQIECNIVVPQEEREQGIVEINLGEATAILREIADLIIIPHFAELKEFINRSFRTADEDELKSERWHRKAQFWIALGIGLITFSFGLISTVQNFRKDNSITINNDHLPIDTLIVKSISVNDDYKIVDSSAISNTIIHDQNLNGGTKRRPTPNKTSFPSATAP